MRSLTIPATVLALAIALPACGKKPREQADKAAKAAKADNNDKAGEADNNKQADRADKNKEAAKAPAAAGGPEPVEQRIAARLKVAGIDFTVKDDTKRKKAFDPAVQPAIAALHKFKFPKTSVQLSVVVLSDPSKKAAMGKELGKLFGQLKAAKDTYKRFFTRRAEDATTALLLVFEPADQAVAKKVADQLRIGVRCAAAMAHGGDRAATTEMIAAALKESGAAPEVGDDKAGDFGAKAAKRIAPAKGGEIVVVTYADPAASTKWLEHKEARWQKLLAANGALTNHSFPGLDTDVVKVLVARPTDADGTALGKALNNLDVCLSKMASK